MRDGTRSSNQINLPGWAVRLMCGLSAPLAFAVAGVCFAFCIQPFGQNPPPKEVALGVGCVFTLIGLFFAGVAIFYRGAPTATTTVKEWGYGQVPDTAVRLPQPSGRLGAPSGARTPGPATRGIKPGSFRDYLSVGALLGLLIGPVLGYMTYQRQQVLDKGKSEPRTLKVAELGKNGPGDNIHVKLTDFEFGDKVSTHSKGGSWTAVCLAAFPKGKAGDPKALKVVVRTSRVRSDEQLREFARKATVQGVVVNSIYEWENDREYMKSAYPGVDASSIWVVQEDYTFPNPSEIQTMYAISSGIVAFALFCGFGKSK
jgi:hypothetical protein